MSIAETQKNFHVQCSNCGSNIDLNDVIIQQIVDVEKKKINLELSQQQEKALQAKEE